MNALLFRHCWKKRNFMFFAGYALLPIISMCTSFWSKWHHLFQSKSKSHLKKCFGSSWRGTIWMQFSNYSNRGHFNYFFFPFTILYKIVKILVHTPCSTSFKTDWCHFNHKCVCLPMIHVSDSNQLMFVRLCCFQNWSWFSNQILQKVNLPKGDSENGFSIFLSTIHFLVLPN